MHYCVAFAMVVINTEKQIGLVSEQTVPVESIGFVNTAVVACEIKH